MMPMLDGGGGGEGPKESQKIEWHINTKAQKGI